jgi:hypothetical protein
LILRDSILLKILIQNCKVITFYSFNYKVITYSVWFKIYLIYGKTKVPYNIASKLLLI